MNLIVDEQKVADYHLTKAYSKLEKMRTVRLGRVGAIKVEQLEPLLLALKANWDYNKYGGIADSVTVEDKLSVSGTAYML